MALAFADGGPERKVGFEGSEGGAGAEVKLETINEEGDIELARFASASVLRY